MITRNSGYQPGLRPSSTQAQAALASTATASVPRPNQVARIRHSRAAPMPVSAPIGGAMASV